VDEVAGRAYRSDFLSRLVQRQQVCLLQQSEPIPARRGRRNALGTDHQPEQSAASTRPMGIVGQRGSRRLADVCSRHQHPGNLRSRRSAAVEDSGRVEDPTGVDLVGHEACAGSRLFIGGERQSEKRDQRSPPLPIYRALGGLPQDPGHAAELPTSPSCGKGWPWR